MPRTILAKQKYEETDFLRHVSAQQHYYGYKTQSALGSAIGCSQSAVCNYMHRPETIQLGTLRKMIKALRLDPLEILRYLGYSTQDIKKASVDLPGSSHF